MMMNKFPWTLWAAFLSAVDLLLFSCDSSYRCNMPVRKLGSILRLLKTPLIIALPGNSSIALEKKYYYFYGYNLMQGKLPPTPSQKCIWEMWAVLRRWWNIHVSSFMPSKHLAIVLHNSQDICRINLILCHFRLFCMAFSMVLGGEGYGGFISCSFCTLHIILDTTVSILLSFPL